MKRFSGLKFSDLKNCRVMDKNDEVLGRLIDAVFKNTDDGLELSKFTIGGSRWEEVTEDLGMRQDIDPVFPASAIERASPKQINLNQEKGDLKSTTIDKDAIEEDEIKLSELSKFSLYDDSGENIGNIIDLMFDKNSFKFIVGDGFLLELMEDAGLRPDVDLLLVPEAIKKIEEGKIILNQNKHGLEELFNKHAPDFKRIDIDTEEDKKGGPKRKTFYFPRSTF